ncbi:unnamed protein product [Heligmosomoides polygyrus]|uniref:SSD domain-containing protein n=1 Tax=Heligmosomoides polygyrus TaxID=6339 RepID=A0A3P8ASV7_HELPZ|nr:unnamed protein product [Heligmosomoides polygyrus]
MVVMIFLQEFLNSDGQGITLFVLLRAQHNQSMIRPEYMAEAVQVRVFNFLSFDQFCGGFCQANEPVRQFYNGLRALEGNVSLDFQQRINLSYPTSEIFFTKFSLLPNFFGVELDEDGKTPTYVSLVALIFRAEKHPSWTTEMVKQWELSVDEYFTRSYDQQRVEVNVLSAAIVEQEILRAGKSLQPFLVVGFIIMCTFCTTTTTVSSIVTYNHKATFNKVVLSVTACILPFMACGTALGAIFLAGVTYSPILCITPFLVLAISVDDAFLMVHAWNRIERCHHKSTQTRAEKIRSFQVCVETGPAIAISAFTNILAFAIGAASSPPEIQIFCIGNAACIFMDMCYQREFIGGKGEDRVFLRHSIRNALQLQEASRLKEAVQGVLRWYTGLIADVRCSLVAVLCWAVFVGGAAAVSRILSFQLFFLSTLLQIDHFRSQYMVPSYTPATVVVTKPGNLSDPKNVRDLLAMKDAFEKLPNAIGSESTKFFLSDYVNYKNAMQEELGDDPTAATLEAFLRWPEYSFWRGFVKQSNTTTETSDVSQFMFVTGFHGDHLASWHERGRLLNRWRAEVDRFSGRFNLSVFSEDGFYVDILEAIPTVTWQSGLATFACVVIICALFINHPATVVFVAMAIFATCIGVFGYMSLFGVTLDPVVMAISIMCIGFSVDIPAHVSFHYHASRAHAAKQSTCSTIASRSSTNQPIFRLQGTICSVGFPVIQAGVSTILCALPLAFVPLYMAQVRFSHFFPAKCVTAALL